MPTNEAKKKYDIQYAKDKLKRIPLDVQKNKYEEIKVSASAAGESINGYIKKAIDQRMERESVTSSPEPTKPNTPERSSPAAPKQEKQYKPFTGADEQQIDFSKLLASIQYQMEIADMFGMDVLNTLVEKARQQEEKETE